METDLAQSKATEPGLNELIGLSGVAVSPLHPGGYAEINGHRVDVITQGEMLSIGDPVSVVEVEGNRVVVAKTESNASSDA